MLTILIIFILAEKTIKPTAKNILINFYSIMLYLSEHYKTSNEWTTNHTTIFYTNKMTSTANQESIKTMSNCPRKYMWQDNESKSLLCNYDGTYLLRKIFTQFPYNSPFPLRLPLCIQTRDNKWICTGVYFRFFVKVYESFIRYTKCTSYS